MGQFYISRGIVLIFILRNLIFPAFSQIHQPFSVKPIKENLGHTHPELMASKFNVNLVIAGWSFDENSLIADQGGEANLVQAITREDQFDGNFSFPAGAVGNSVSSGQWSNGMGSKYWVVKFSTAGYRHITLSSRQRSSNTGPRDFSVQYCISGDADWMDVENGIIILANDFAGGTIQDLLLPEACSDIHQLYIRWVMTSDIAVNGAAVAGSGTSRIDEILVNGVSTTPVNRKVTSVETLQTIVADEGTPFAGLNLPDSVWVELDDNEQELLAVLWISDGYNENQPVKYFIEGQIVLHEGMDNPDDFMATIEVQLLPVIKYFDVEFILEMNNVPGFDPLNDLVLISGSIFNNAIPGTLPDLQVMENTGNGFYRKTLNLLKGSYTYKYFINMGLINPEPGSDRLLDLDQNKIMQDVWSITSASESFPVGVRVFPNPAGQSLFISSDHMIDDVLLTDLKGVTMINDEIRTFSFSLSVNDFPAGLYLLRLNIRNEYSFHKVFLGVR